MSTRQLRRRVESIEDRVNPRSDGSCTLTELYWSIWCRNKERFLEMAQDDCTLGVFLRQPVGKQHCTIGEERRSVTVPGYRHPVIWRERPGRRIEQFHAALAYTDVIPAGE